MTSPVNICSLCTGYISTDKAYILIVIAAVLGFIAYPVGYKLGALWKARHG